MVTSHDTTLALNISSCPRAQKILVGCDTSTRKGFATGRSAGWRPAAASLVPSQGDQPSQLTGDRSVPRTWDLGECDNQDSPEHHGGLPHPSHPSEPPRVIPNQPSCLKPSSPYLPPSLLAAERQVGKAVPVCVSGTFRAGLVFLEAELG